MYTTGDGARQMSYADGTLWVLNQDVGTVTGIDATTVWVAHVPTRIDHAHTNRTALMLITTRRTC